jgi:Na+/H+ antiporter NhaD/arsenite permease-like protein
LIALAIFFLSYVLVVVEETIHLRKSKPVLLAGGIIWALIGVAYMGTGRSQQAYDAAAHTIFEYGELFLFLLVAITYVNTLEERRVFEAMRSRLVSFQLGYRSLFWITGTFAFILSPILDNLRTGVRKIRCHRLHECRCRRERRRSIFSLRRHHDLDGVAEGQG